MEKISTFIFDCFGVIYDPVIYKWYYTNSSKYGFTDDELPNVLRKFDLGILGEDDLVDYLSRYKGLNSTKEKILNEIDSYLKIDQNLIYIIKQLKQKGFKTILLSNGNHHFFERKIFKTNPEFKNLFDEIVISSLVNMVKPDTEIFLYTLKQAKSTPQESLFVDDNKDNVDVAVSLGMKGFVYTDILSFDNYIKSIGIDLIN